MELSTEKPIFVCGVPKSGTTMVGRILANHPDLQTDFDVSPTVHFLKYVRDAMDNYWFFKERQNSPMAEDNSYWTDNNYKEWHSFNIEYFKTLHKSYRSGATRWGSSTCFTHQHRELLWKWFPEARFLMITRDPRDHWCSFRMLPTYHWDQFLYFKKEAASMNEMDSRFNYVEYHDVVRDPTILFGILGLSVPENYLNGVKRVFIDRSNGAQSDVPNWVYELQHGNGIISSRVGRWKRDLDKEELDRCTEAFPDECMYYDEMMKQ